MTDAILKAYEQRCAKAEAKVAFLQRACEFYANRNHWMAPSDSADSLYKLLVANGETGSGYDGWGMADWALERARRL
jgi:hypothetical protein